MKPTVYIETTIPSYLTAWPSKDVIVAGHQKSTHDWWDEDRQKYRLFASDVVYEEASKGDPTAAQERLEVLKELTLLTSLPEVRRLANELVFAKALPAKASEDAAHIAIAAVWKMDYLLTWNMRHMDNAFMKPHIEAVCIRMGFKAPTICNPEALYEAIRHD